MTKKELIKQIEAEFTQRIEAGLIEVAYIGIRFMGGDVAKIKLPRLFCSRDCEHCEDCGE